MKYSWKRSTVSFLGCVVVMLCMAACCAPRSYADDIPGGGYSAGDLDQMLAPIALYPDPILAQIFPSATFQDQLQQAADLTQYEQVDESVIAARTGI